MRIIYLGTPQFAVDSLEALVRAGHDVLAVYTQPDRPKGRGQALAASPVKEAALRLGLPVRQPERLKADYATLAADQADVMAVVGYGQLIPQSIIDLPRHGIINVHGSLLPHYRGAAPIQWAIANGERVTGVTTMKIDAGLDTGDMLLKASTEIGPEETAPELSQRLAVLGADLLLRTLAEIDTLVPEKQDPAQATLARILTKEDGRVSFARTAHQIHCRARGFTPWPGATTVWRGQPLGLGRMQVSNRDGLAPGELLVEAQRLYVGCGDGTVLELLEVQPPGKKRMPVTGFLQGARLQQGERLG
ncbi:MAG: methionyl-tRNA formyltransferase [Bryobacteraceae bacterium]|nr:methionyl-tRNA formyltransferase [Bryobacteraceae bacterium]